jgi:TonB family protein
MREKKIGVIMLLTTACALAAQQPIKLTAPDKSFEASFPGEFIHEQGSGDSGRAHFETNSYFFETSESKFILTYIQLSPPPPVDFNSDEAINVAIGRTVENANGRLLTENPIAMNGNAAKAVVISVGESTTIDGRFLYVKSRVYELLVRHKKGVIPPFEQRFFDSFSLKTTAPINADQRSTSEQYGAVAIQMLTRNEGVDFTPFLKRLMELVTGNWYAKMPEAARVGIKGKVALHLRIQKNGALESAPAIETSSGEKALDDAAVAAIVASAPFEQFPENFQGPDVEFRAMFLYNVLPPKR